MKFDLHVHSIYSADSITPVEKLCERYAKLGFGGFALTDHRTFDGVKKAQAYAREKKLPIQVIGGCEFMSERGEVIGLELNEPIISSSSKPTASPPAASSPSPSYSPGRPIHEFASLCDAIHDQGGFVVLPHPFDLVRRHICRPDLLLSDQLRQVDAIETFNARSISSSTNHRAAAFAKLPLPSGAPSPSGATSPWPPLACTGGSDAHFLFECGHGFTQIPDDMELGLALRKKQTVAGGQLSPFFVHGPTTLVKWGKKLGLLPRPPL
jgi:hypothetical protein